MDGPVRCRRIRRVARQVQSSALDTDPDSCRGRDRCPTRPRRAACRAGPDRGGYRGPGSDRRQDGSGRRPVHGGASTFQEDPHWRDLILFYEYFHGDNGAGIGASHQTGWTGSIARLLDFFGRVTAADALETPRAVLEARVVRQQVGGE